MPISFHEEKAPERRKSGSEYRDCIQAFFGTDFESARIDCEERAVDAMTMGLNSALRFSEFKDKARVIRRDGKVYIVRTDDENDCFDA